MRKLGEMPLAGVRVLDLSRTLAGAYSTKLLVDAGADVVKVEPSEGDPLRQWNDAGVDLESDGGLFQYLCASKRAVVGDPREVSGWASDVDLLLEDLGPGVIDIAHLLELNPRLVVTSITPFGHHGPWAHRPATEFTLQAICGSLAGRGDPDRPPLSAGGRLGEWLGGSYAAVASLAAYRRAIKTGCGDHVDVSMLEIMVRVFGRYGLVQRQLGGTHKGRSRAIPSIIPTSDGVVGMLLASRQNYNDFVTLIGRPDLEETDFWKLHVRFQRRDEFLSFVHAWSTTQTTADIIELLSAFRIPVTPVGNGATVPTLEQCVANDVFTVNPSGGFPQPRVPYTISDIATQPFGPAPTLQDRTTTPEWATPRVEAAFDTPNPDACELPLSGIRVIDFTSYWAGPEATDLLGVLGAEVIKVESPFRPDPERAVSERLDEDEWWEYGANFHGTDRNKRGIAIDLSAPTGQEVMLKLVATADVVIENFRPGVLDRLGLTLEAIRDVAPRAVLVRMPAFGLAGPWKMRGAFGPNIEQVTGMAFSTGYGPEEPIAPGGPCDPIAGTHAAFATLAALQARDRSGNGNVVVATMFEAGLNVAAELVIEQAAYSHLVQPRGNRGPEAVPQGAFLCAGDDNWVAIAVESAYEWLALHRLLDLPERLAGPEFLSVAGRREVEDEIEATLAAWCATREQHEICRILEELRIPAEPITTSFVIDANPQLQARGFFETVKHSLVGDELHPSVGFQFASRTEPWLRRAAPTLGEHNDEVLTEIGLTQAEIDDLYATQIIGTTWLTRR